MTSSDHRRIIFLLLLKQRIRHRQRHPNIQLCNRHLYPKLHKRPHRIRYIRRHFAHNKVALQSDTVDGYISEGEVLDERCHGGRFGTGVLDVVVVYVELCGGVGFACGFEGCGDETGPKSVVEDV